MTDVLWIKREIDAGVLMSDRWISLTLAERGLLESAARAILLYGPLADDPQAVAQRVMALPSDHDFIRDAWPRIRALLIPREDGRLGDPEMDAALADASSRITQARENGKLGGRPKKPGGFDAKTGRFPNENRAGKRPLSDNSTERKEIHTLSLARAARPTGLQDFLAAYPKKTKQDAAARAYLSIIETADEHARLMAGLDRWLASDQWRRSLESDGGRFIPNPDKFVFERRYLDQPTPEQSENSGAHDAIAVALKLMRRDEKEAA